MKKFILQIIFIFFLPILCVAIVAEYSLRQIPNDYSYKNQWMEMNSKNIHILCLGSSSVFFGINPIYFDKKAFNGAHVSQSLAYDNFIFNKFINRMDSLQYLVLDINILSPFSSLENTEEWWRVKNYCIYYGSNYHPGEIKYNYELAVHKLSTFKNALNGLKSILGLHQYSNINVSELGFGLNYSSKNKILDWDNGKPNALRQNELIKKQVPLNLMVKNKMYINEIIKKCVERNIKVLLISTPSYRTFRENLDTNYLKVKNEFCRSFVSEKNNVEFVDFSNDIRFIEEDYFDAYHLNEIGAKKFTTIINDKLSNWKLKLRTQL